MQKSNSRILYSATDLVGFLECEHLTSLDLLDLDCPLPRAPEDEQVALIQQKGHAHERQYVEQLRARTRHFVDISERRGGVWERIGFTIEAMRAGAEIIYQGALASGDFMGYPDFLRRVDRASSIGAHSYEVVDAKLARSEKTKFIVQLAFYSQCLTEIQGAAPLMMHVVLGDHTEVHYRFSEYARYVAELKRRFEERVKDGARVTYPDPCDQCALCKWAHLCEERRTADDHLCHVAGITKAQIKKLQDAGIGTLKALGTLNPVLRVAKIAPTTLDRICNQARLQLEARDSGARKVELLPRIDGEARGLARLPRPDSGDLFFDMEGNPYEDKGLEYLFGVYYFEHGEPKFKAFWAHSRSDERKAFEGFMDFATARLITHPDAYIYHYAHYEPTALQRLMTMHGTRESELDNLLRRRKFIDLYRVVCEGIRVSEPSYSIKNIEHFYLGKRTAEVTDAGASIVFYERWKQTGDAQLLKDIETYNFDDVRSTHQLREWLLSLRPTDVPWANDLMVDDGKQVAAGELTDTEKRLIPYRRALFEALPGDRSACTIDDMIRELTFYLLDFHRRADKPAYWKMFARQDMSHEDLIDDGECIGGLTLVGKPVSDKRSLVWTYEYPEQESKLRDGSKATLTSTREALGEIECDPDKRRIRIRRGAGRVPLDHRISIGPASPFGAKEIVDAVFRFADTLVDGSRKYGANEAFLRRDAPIIKGHLPGNPIVNNAGDVEAVVDAVARLDISYLFIQGPPGAGKTFTGSHAIVELVRLGFRVGVMSNTHKAINNLLTEVERVATSKGVAFRGAKKSSSSDDESRLNGTLIEDVFKNEHVDLATHVLIAGTAWLFADPDLDQALDFLFVDEAGQVSLANLIAAGTSAKSIVLLGDQMQLGQPIQGSHPGSSGQSTLEYLLQGKATISPDRGIFLSTTWRMHPRVCSFISDAVYDGRLEPELKNKNQELVLDEYAHPVLKSAGIAFVDAHHEACSQESAEEASIVRDLIANLLTQRFIDRDSIEHPLHLDNILVVAPYNMQVNQLKRVLPGGARIGTVDKFQGQQAEVVIVSMTTSSGDYLPRFIDFLFSKNRLNVAISRARSLAIVVANPSLLSIRCKTPDDMALVNTLCWVREYAGEQQ